MFYFDNTDRPLGNRIIDLKRLTDLGPEPVSLTEAKTKLRVDFTDDDTEITALITRARRYVENKLNISVVYQRIQLIACLECEWKLPYGPVVGLEAVSNSQGSSGSGPVTYEPVTSDWQIDGDLYNPAGAFYRQKIVYTAGYGICPDDLKDLILQVVVFLYENRGRGVDVNKLGEIILNNGSQYFVPIWI